MIRIDPKTIYLIAGKQNGKISNKTWILEFNDTSDNILCANPVRNLNIREGPTF